MYTLTFDNGRRFEFARLSCLVDYFRLCMNLSTYAACKYVVTNPAGETLYAG